MALPYSYTKYVYNQILYKFPIRRINLRLNEFIIKWVCGWSDTNKTIHKYGVGIHKAITKGNNILNIEIEVI